MSIRCWSSAQLIGSPVNANDLRAFLDGNVEPRRKLLGRGDEQFVLWEFLGDTSDPFLMMAMM